MMVSKRDVALSNTWKPLWSAKLNRDREACWERLPCLLQVPIALFLVLLDPDLEM